MEFVRLTLQLRDKQNRVRVTTHNDVPLGQVSTRAAEIAGGMAAYYRKEKKHLAPPEDKDEGCQS